MEDDKIIPFGKHKGRSVEEVEAIEPQYLEWLSGQPWFRDKYVVLHQTIINHGSEPSDTPEHNAMQVKFLENDYCFRFASVAGFDWETKFEERRLKAIDDQGREAIKLRKEAESYRPTGHSTDGWVKKMFDENTGKAVAAEQSIPLLKEAKPEFGVVNRVFEHQGIDVRFGTVVSAVKSLIYFDRFFNVEIKPVVGDDYPAVLRQIRRLQPRYGNLEFHLLVGRYTGTGATREQFVATMKTADVTVVFAEDVQ